MRHLAKLEWMGAAFGMAGSSMLALNMSWSGWAYPLLLVFSSVMLALAVARQRWPYAALFATFTAINMLGIYRWLLAG